MELREWLIILGLVLVAIILVDGVRRLQRQRRGLRMDLSQDIDASEPARDPDDVAREERMNWELPSGGARVVGRADRERDDIDAAQAAKHRREGVGSASRTRSESPRTAPLYADEEEDAIEPRFVADPLDDAPHEPSRPRREHFDEMSFEEAPFDDERFGTSRHDEERFDDEPFDDALHEDEFHDDASFEERPRRRDELGRRFRSAFARGGERLKERRKSREEARRPGRAGPAPDEPRPEPRAAPAGDAFEPETAWQDGAPYDESVSFDEPAPRHARESDELRHPVVERAARGMVRGEKARDALRDAEEVIVISVLSKDEAGFEGTDLLQLVLACGLCLDEQGVFHRFETESNQSPLQFSMVNVLKPGIFDLDAIETQAVPGVTLLMPLPGAQAPREAFEAMYETAMVLVRNLGGELKDENRSVMTAQTVSFARQRVHEFERRWRLHRHQAH